MANLISTNIQPNEVIKAADINNGNEASIGNIAKSLDVIFDPDKDFLIGGKITPSTTGMSFILGPVFGICHTDSNGNQACEPIVETGNNVISLPASGSNDKLYLIEIKGKLEETTEEQRAFIDFDTGSKTLQNVKTKNELKLDCKITTNDTLTAPDKDNSYIKLCEVLVPANALTAADCEFYEVTADVKNMENSAWSNEKTVTYNAGYISDVNNKFRQYHNLNGSHKNESINSDMIVKSGTKPINANVLLAGGNGTIADDNTTFTNTASILAVLQKMAEKITSFYEVYQLNGNYGFKGEITISNSENFDASKSVKIGSDGNGSGYVKIGNTKIFDISNGKIVMASNNKELVTKDITDGLNTRVTANETAIEGFSEIVKNSQQYSNEVFNRIKYGTSVRIAVGTNITLAGEQTIQGISLNTGDKILVMGQDDKTQNGIYLCSTQAWSRLQGYGENGDTLETIKNNLLLRLFSIDSGTYEGKLYYCALPLTKFNIEQEGGVWQFCELDFIESIFADGNVANTAVFRNGNNVVKANVDGYASRIQINQPSGTLEAGTFWLE